MRDDFVKEREPLSETNIWEMMVIIFCVTAITIATSILNTAKMRVFGTYATVSNCFSMDIAEFDLDESILSFSTSAIQLYVSSTIPFYISHSSYRIWLSCNLYVHIYSLRLS